LEGLQIGADDDPLPGESTRALHKINCGAQATADRPCLDFSAPGWRDGSI
jgi:hypothetical protein